MTSTVNVFLDFPPNEDQPKCEVEPKKYQLVTNYEKIGNGGLDFVAAKDKDTDVKIHFHIRETSGRTIEFCDSDEYVKYSYWPKEDKPTGKKKYKGQTGWAALVYDKIENKILKVKYNNQYSLEYSIYYSISGGEPIEFDPGLKNNGTAPVVEFLLHLHVLFLEVVMALFVALGLRRSRF